MADNSKKDLDVILNQNQPNSTGSENTGESTETEDEPVENKFNEYTSYWDAKDQEFKMSTDTPTVRIFISREIVPDEMPEEAEEIELTDAEKISHDMSVVYQMTPDITPRNSTVVKLEGKQVLAMNAIDKLDLNNAPK